MSTRRDFIKQSSAVDGWNGAKIQTWLPMLNR